MHTSRSGVLKMQDRKKMRKLIGLEFEGLENAGLANDIPNEEISQDNCCNL